MCGICGSYDYLRQRAPDPVVLDAMSASLMHRGPDGAGAHIDGAAGIAARRRRPRGGTRVIPLRITAPPTGSCRRARRDPAAATRASYPA